MPKGQAGLVVGQMQGPQAPAQQYYQQVNGFGSQGGTWCLSSGEWIEDFLFSFLLIRAGAVWHASTKRLVVKVIGAAFQSVQTPPLLLVWKYPLNTLSSSLLLKIRCFPPLFENMLLCQEWLCGRALQDFCACCYSPWCYPIPADLGGCSCCSPASSGADYFPPLPQLCWLQKLLSSGNSKLRACFSSCGYSLLWKHLPSQV